MKNKCIVHIVWAFQNGGIEAMLVNIANKQIIFGHKIYIIIINNKVDNDLVKELNPKIKVLKINRREGSRNIWPIIKANLVLLFIKPQIFHFHSLTIAKLFIKLPKTKFISTIHDSRFSERYFNKFDKFIAISDCVNNEIKRVNPAIKPITCYNGINFNRIKQKSIYKKIKDIVCVGRLRTLHKGQDKIIKAIHILNKNNKHQFNLTLIGEGPNEKELRDLTKQYNLDDNVCFLGNKPNTWVIENLCNFDLFIQASNYEGFGLTALEAMGAKVPTILSNVDGHLEISDNGKYSTLFNVNDPESLANKIIEISNRYLELREFSEHAFEYAYNKFSIEKQVNKLEQIYFRTTTN